MNTPHRPACLFLADPDEGAALLAAAALGEALGPADAALLGRALAACERCRADYDDYAALAGVLPHAAPLAEPSPDLRRRILAGAADAQAAPAKRRPAAPGWRRLAGWGAAAALLLALLGWNLALRRQISGQQAAAGRYRASLIALMGDDDARECRLASPGAPSGRIYLAPAARVLGAYGKNLPPPPAGAAYQLRVNGARVARLEVDQNGRAWSLVQNLEQPALNQPAAIVITLEPDPAPAAPPAAEPVASCEI